MSEIGDIIEQILKIIRDEDKVTVEDIKEKAHLRDTNILDFMMECGLIKFENGVLRIGEFGFGVLSIS